MFNNTINKFWSRKQFHCLVWFIDEWRDYVCWTSAIVNQIKGISIVSGDVEELNRNCVAVTMTKRPKFQQNKSSSHLKQWCVRHVCKIKFKAWRWCQERLYVSFPNFTLETNSGKNFNCFVCEITCGLTGNTYRETWFTVVLCRRIKTKELSTSADSPSSFPFSTVSKKKFFSLNFSILLSR